MLSSGWQSVIGVSEEIAAGAVISGAYFGDKMTPLSETTILVPQLVGGLTVATAPPGDDVDGASRPRHQPHHLRDPGSDRRRDGGGRQEVAQDAIESVFSISIWNLLPLFLMILLTFKQVPPFLALMASAPWSPG